MNEIRIKFKSFVIGVIAVVFSLFYLALRTPDCPNLTNDAYTYQPQQVPQNKQTITTPQPFTVYAITPTYARPVQKAELTRLAQTLLLVPFVHWIIVEDDEKNSDLVRNLLARTGLNKRSTLLFAKTPSDFKLKRKDPSWTKPRGVAQRNEALKWVRKNVEYSPNSQSAVYFMDDDNTYSTELFEDIKNIKPGKVAVWPVGLVGGLLVEKPVLDDDNRVLGFNSAWRPERPFAIDMAGFAISTDLLFKYPNAVFSYDVERGYQESEILRYLVVVRDLQPLANFCREIFVWHTRTEAPKLDAEAKLRKDNQQSNKGMEV
ncbi:galactosylgalactosylxylosylprotein 3-beta-glucuronosyltransferase I [Contarinia nasturtii]|uniref:galactosylgalactosylxylosylprotein 3-beta-glucuronosyltransferase I n=1 Tax=Contarinia nasturtii TaxID=265458 RepID=UPI0012D4114B|nr:galactosylgalactosylxylosylprotein 3-beta-glucuronosyltransferase I [Contarinia nasturtii]